MLSRCEFIKVILVKKLVSNARFKAFWYTKYDYVSVFRKAQGDAEEAEERATLTEQAAAKVKSAARSAM